MSKTHNAPRRGQRPLAVLLAGLLSLSALPAPAAQDAGVDLDNRILRTTLDQEPPQLDSTKATDTVSNQILGHVMEGLTTYNTRGELVPGVAERWEVRGDGATFWLREEARWSDGEPVTAHDFVFAWRKVVDPATASEYAFITYGIENAEAINNGELPVEALGVEAIDDHTLEIRLARTIPFLDKLVAFNTFFPVRQDFYESRGQEYAADADDLLFNGPFMMTEWVHGASVRLKKNPHYWDAGNIWLEGIEYPYITTDPNAILNLFKDGKIALAPLGSETMQTALDERWRIQRFADGSAWYIEFNFREGRLTRNWHLRRAMALTFDPYEFVNRVVGVPGNLPGRTIFPAWLQGVERKLRVEIPPPEPELDYEEARRHLELAKEELGIDEFPPLVLLTGDTPAANKQAEYFQSLWKRTLGLDIRIDKQIFKQRLQKMTDGEFDMVAAGWGPDYNDPLTFGDLFASWNLNNRGRYSNPELDAAVRRAQNSVDPWERLAAFDDIQRVLLADHGIIPTYERGRIFVVHPQLRGYVRRQLNPDPDFARAWFEAD